MQTVNFKGSIHDRLYEFFAVKDKFSVGEKLTHLEKIMKKRFFYASDEEIYNALTEAIKTDYYTDEEIN